MADVRLAGPADADELAHILAVGFADDPVLTWVFQEPDQSLKLQTFFGFLAREAYIPLGAAYLLSGTCSGWTPPGTPDWSPEQGARFRTTVGPVCAPDDFERLGIFDALTEDQRPEEPHWYLSVIATVPELRGQGQGSAMLRHCLQFVDASGLPAFLESTNPVNVSLYLRHGFVVIDEVPLPDGPSFTTMWREASG